jgi:hypothetical protein
MTLLLHDTFTDVAGTDVVSHTTDDGKTWKYGTYATTPVSQKIGGTDGVVYASAASGTLVHVPLSAPASGFDMAACVVYERVGTLTTNNPSNVYQAIDSTQGGPGSLGLPGGYGIRWVPSGSAGDGQWTIRKAMDDGSTTQVLFQTSVLTNQWPTTGTKHTAVLQRKQITGGVRLFLYVDGVLLNTGGTDDTTAAITRVGDVGLTASSITVPTSNIAVTELFAANPAANVTAPSLTGTAQVGQPLTAGGDVWSDTAFTVTYQWQRSTDGGSTWTNIAGATGTTYTPVLADQTPNQVRVLASYWGPGGTATAASSAVSPAAPPLLTAADFEVRLSGGGSNTDERLSIGGAMGAVVVVDPTDISGALIENIFDRIIGSAALVGQTDYRLVYLHNKHATYDADVVAWIAAQPTDSHLHFAIGAPVEAAGAIVTGPADRFTAPSGVTFSSPSSSGTGVALGTIAHGSFRGLWIRRIADPNTPPASTPISYELRATLTQL